MGSSLGLSLADVFLAQLEHIALSEQITEVAVYRRYVNCVIRISDSTLDPCDTLSDLNQAREGITSTLEMESSDGLSFLNVFLSRCQNDSVQSSVYRNKTWAEKYVHYVFSCSCWTVGLRLTRVSCKNVSDVFTSALSNQ